MPAHFDLFRMCSVRQELIETWILVCKECCALLNRLLRRRTTLKPRISAQIRTCPGLAIGQDNCWESLAMSNQRHKRMKHMTMATPVERWRWFKIYRITHRIEIDRFPSAIEPEEWVMHKFYDSRKYTSRLPGDTGAFWQKSISVS